jgi:hypothetical protein
LNRRFSTVLAKSKNTFPIREVRDLFLIVGFALMP